MGADIRAFFATGDEAEDGFAYRIFRRFTFVTDGLERIGSAFLGLFINLGPPCVVGYMKLRVEPLQCVASGFEHHFLQIVTENFITAALKDTGTGKSFVQQFANLALGGLFGGLHGRTGFGAFRGIGNTSLIQRGAGGLVVDEVVAQVIGRTLGNEHKNSRGLIARLP